MTSDRPREAFLWAWLPDADEPVVAGRLEAVGGTVLFNYDVAEAAELTTVDRDCFWQRQFLNPFALQDYSSSGSF